MECLVVITPIVIADAELRMFIEDEQGYWIPRTSGGTVEKPNARVFVGTMNEPSYDDEELRKLTEKVGTFPKGFLTLHIGTGEQSLALARELADRAVGRFGGIIDDNTGALFAS